MSNSSVLVLIFAFFYCNATAFAVSLVVIVLILVLAIRHDKKGKDNRWVVVPLRLVMVLDLLSLMGAYGAGTCRDRISTVYSAVLVAIVFLYILVLKTMDCWDKNSGTGTGTGSSSVDCLCASTATSSPVVSLAVLPTGSLVHDSMLVMSDTAPRPLSTAVAIVRLTLHFFSPSLC